MPSRTTLKAYAHKTALGGRLPRWGEVVQFFFLNPICAADRITPRDMHLPPV